MVDILHMIASLGLDPSAIERGLAAAMALALALKGALPLFRLLLSWAAELASRTDSARDDGVIAALERALDALAYFIRQIEKYNFGRGPR